MNNYFTVLESGKLEFERIASLTILQANTYFGDISDIFQSVSVLKFLAANKVSVLFYKVGTFIQRPNTDHLEKLCRMWKSTKTINALKMY